MRRQFDTFFLSFLLLLTLPSVAAKPVSLIRFQVTLGKNVSPRTGMGRLIVTLGKTATPEPRGGIGRTGMDADPILGRDENGFSAKTRAILDEKSAIFPIESLSVLPPGGLFRAGGFRRQPGHQIGERAGKFVQARSSKRISTRRKNASSN